MTLLTHQLSALPQRECLAVRAGAVLVTLFLVTYLGYLLFGHALVRGAYHWGIIGESHIAVSAYEKHANWLFDRWALKPLLLAGITGFFLGVWSLRRSPAFQELRDFWRTTRGAPRVVMLILCGLLIGGHLVNSANENRHTFPFVRWRMYTRVYEPAEMKVIDLYVVAQNGERHLVNVGRTVPSIQRAAPRTVTVFVERQLDRGTRARVDELALALGSIYARLHDVSVNHVEVVEEVVYRDAPGAYRRDSRLLARIFPPAAP